MFESFLLVLVVVALVRTLGTPRRLTELQDELTRQQAEQARQQRELEQLRSQLASLHRAALEAPTTAPPVAVSAPVARPAAPPVVAPPAAPAPLPRPVPPVAVPAPRPVVAPAPVAIPPVQRPTPVPAPVARPEPVLAATPAPVPVAGPAPMPVAAPTPVAAPPVVPPVPPAPPRRPVPPPAPEPTGPTWWERASTVLLENWTGILGAVVLVTGVGFLGIYTALRLAPPYRFLLICLFAAGLLGGRYALRNKEFARKLNAWLLSSAAAIFLFACVGAVSIPGLRWVTAPFDYLLLLAGVSANLYLAWRSSREEVATLHGVLSLVALAVLPPTAVTLGAAAGVTAFSIAITYRQRWRYQLLLSIASFFVFHLYWHRQLVALPNGLRLTAMALVLLVGAAAAVVQYRRVYAQRRFDALLFAAHVLNWTCLGINLYLYSTGSPWKTIPLALGAGLTYWTGQQAKRLGIGWLFQTDTILSLMLALATALSLQGWHATPAVIGLSMLLEALLVALVMARQREPLVYRMAMAGALLAGAGLLVATGAYAGGNPLSRLYRDALVLTLAGWAGLAFVQLIFRQPLLAPAEEEGADEDTWAGDLLRFLAGVAGLLQAGAGGLLALAVFDRAGAPVAWLLAALAGLAGAALALGRWVQATGLAPDWVRRQQVVLAQALAATAVLGLHELGLVWPAVLLALYAETLLAVLLLARRDSLLYRAGLGAALLAGGGLLVVATGHVAHGLPTELYRDAGLLTAAAVLSLVFARHSYQQLPGDAEAGEPAGSELYQTLLGWLAGLAGLLQTGAGLLLGRLVFHWSATVPPGYGLGALVALAALALAGAAWLGRSGAVPAWVRRQQLVLGHYAVVLAIAGLHELGLSWPGVALALYAEGLLAALLLPRLQEEDLLHLQTYLLLLQAATLPLLVFYTSPGALTDTGRAALLVGAALLTVLYQLRRRYLRGEQPEFARLPLGGEWQLPLLGLAVGWLLLGAGSFVYEQQWAGWVALGLLGGLLVLRRQVAMPGLWAGLLLAGAGYLALQWRCKYLWKLADDVSFVIPAPLPGSSRLATLLYLLPTTLLVLLALATYWWPARHRFVRWPWLYLLGLHLLVAVAATTHGPVGLTLGTLGLAVAAFAAALLWRRTLPDEAAVARAGQPDRYLLHLTYLLLAGSLALHTELVLSGDQWLFHLPAEYFTAGALFAALAALALVRPPATGPVYRSWQWLHPWLPEAALLFGSATLMHHLRWPWQPLLWVGAALVLSYFGPQLPLRFRRLAVYGRLYYWLAAASVSVICLTRVSPGYLLQPGWWALVAAVALLFAYVALALREDGPGVPGLSPAWDALACPARRTLEVTLLYPAFVALFLLLYQSFDRSVLTVLLMLEVVAIFSTSLLLRRQDLRYVALAGMLACLVRLVFFDLSRSGTITRAIVFIFMGLLLLGMNALYARFKSRMDGNDQADAPLDDEVGTDEPQPLPS